ncbi:MAG: UvrD-helicase domain-containing protein [Clostridia bacterium]|nr:UvrD-helicase domain-containing protein [Clostridia bacterium]
MDLTALNPEQRRAAETLEGPVLILAGAGSGKTRALTYRVANLIDHGVPAWSILALTFTNKAAKEMKNRVEQLIGAEKAEEAWISTFHSTCARILRRDIEKIGYSRSFTIYDDDDQQRVLKEILKQQNIDDRFLPVKEIRAKISDAKNKMLTPDEWFQKSFRDRRNSMIHDVMTEYEKRMKSLNALDFDDLLLKTLILLADHPPVLEMYRHRFRYVLVDEYQDTNRTQYELIRLLTAESRNLCVVGDDDQSIYGWRGADIRNILEFENDYPDATVIKLEQNYRSTGTILDAANQVIAHNEGRKDKTLWTEHGAGEQIRVYCAQDEREEAAWIVQQMQDLRKAGAPLGEMAILYRTNAQSRIPEEVLMQAGIPYKVFGGQKFYERKEIKDILAYLRVIANPADDVSLTRIINVPKRSIGDTTVQLLTEHAAGQGIPLYAALAVLPEDLGSRAKNSVNEFFRMMTMLCAMKESMELEAFIDEMIRITGLEEQYRKEDTDEAMARIENIQEFRGSVHEFAQITEGAGLEEYLENVALVTDLDREEGQNGYAVLMTLHSAKGLEFDNVFIPGMEEGIFPSARSMEEENRLEEERRLMYVGITRARKRLFLTRASERMLYNQYGHNPPSRFLEEIPPRLIREEFSHSARFGTGRPAAQLNRRYESDGWEIQDFPDAEPRTSVSASSLGKPKLKIKGHDLSSIPGVSRGFAGSKAHQFADSAMQKLFAPGDRVRHPKFGAGIVKEVSGIGKEARIRILFDTAGEKELALSIAPIVKTEETE